MQQVVHTIATLAAFAALACGLWQNWGLGVTLKKTLISYLAVFILGGLMVLAVRILPLLDGGAKSEDLRDGGPRKGRQ